MNRAPVVYVIACSAPPVMHLGELLDQLATRGWDPCVILTPTAASWVPVDELTERTRYPVRAHPLPLDQQDPLPHAAAILAAPLTFNTLNKWANGISDTLALGLLNDALGLDLPIIAAPVIKPTLRRHPAYATSLRVVRDAGVTILDPDRFTQRDEDGTVHFDWTAVAGSVESRQHRSPEG